MIGKLSRSAHPVRLRADPGYPRRDRWSARLRIIGVLSASFGVPGSFGVPRAAITGPFMNEETEAESVGQARWM